MLPMAENIGIWPMSPATSARTWTLYGNRYVRFTRAYTHMCGGS